MQLFVISLKSRLVAERKIGSREELRLEREAFDAACKLADILMATKRGLVGLRRGAQSLQEGSQEYLAKHILAYGKADLTPKNHWVFDVCECLLRDSTVDEDERPWRVMDAFVLERLHLRVRGPIEHVDTMQSFEKSVVVEVSNEQVRRF